MKTPIDTLLDQVVLTEVKCEQVAPEGMPYVTHEGTPKLGEVEIGVVVLNTGQRLLTGDFVEQLVNEFKKIERP